MESLLFIPAGLLIFFVVRAIARWIVRRERAGCAARAERSRQQAERETVMRYKSGTTPGRKARAATSSSPSAATPDTYTSPAWDIPAMSTVHSPSEPSGLEPTIIGGGGSFSGAGASGGWEPSSCSGSDYSSGSDSGSSPCSSSSGDY